MTVEYRSMRPTEEEAAVQLWTTALETSPYEAGQTFRDFCDNPLRFDQCRVAVADDGTLLATVCYWLRTVRGIDGQPEPVGHLYHVATRPTAQRQGHAGQLLRQTLQALRQAHCTWAILSARQIAVPLYERYGWQAVPRTYVRGTYDEAHWQHNNRYRIEVYDPRQTDDGWLRLAAVYAKASAQQPGCLIRTHAYWTGYGAWMFGLYLDAYQAILLTAQEQTVDTHLRGYALVNFYEAGFVVSEIATDPADPAVLASLLTGIISEADKRQVPRRGQLTIPMGAATEAMVNQYFGSTFHTVDDTALYGYMPFMICPVQPAGVAQQVANPFTTDGSLFWPLDAY